jgi:AAA ATPase domain
MAYQVTVGRFVGRTQELARLRELLARAAAGEPLIALIGGEAGVGKTRLVEQLAATASGQGTRVLRGGCVPLGEEGLPFAPVTEALRALVDQLDPDELHTVAGPARQELGRLLPESQSRPSRWAMAAASTRPVTPSLASRLETCTPTVLGLMNSSWAIWRLLRPAATNASISASRGVRPSCSAGVGAAAVGAVAAGGSGRGGRAEPAPAPRRRGGGRPAEQ